LQIELKLKSIQNRLEFIKRIFGERGNLTNQKEKNTKYSKENETSQKFKSAEHSASWT
jgi:hypothetical protein